VQFAVENEADVMSYFDHYIPPEITEIVVDQTNLYAQQQIAKMPRPVTKHARSEGWKPVTVIEIKKKILGLIFVTGTIRKPKLELYWSTRGIFQTPVFPQIMSTNRFQHIQKYLHFNDNNAAGTSEDLLYKIRTILDILVNNFRTKYIPDREICLGEGMLGWRGLCDFVCITQAKLQSTAYYPFTRKTVKWPKAVFFHLLHCCLFNNYVTFSKNNHNSRKSFLDFMSDIIENLIHTSDAVSSPSSSDESQGSSRTPTPTPKKVPPKMTPLAGLMEN